MKLQYILPVLVALPASAFADNTSLNIRPFVGYDINLASSSNVKIKQSGTELGRTDSVFFNDDNAGDFVFGVEFDDVMAVSLNPSITKVKIKGVGTDKINEIDAQFDFYLTRNSNFKPFATLKMGYMSMDGDVKASGLGFGLDIGCRQYINDNIYLGTNLTYNISTKMHVDEINGINVSGVNMRTSGFSLTIGGGYRF